jgi:hypothetical protein
VGDLVTFHRGAPARGLRAGEAARVVAVDAERQRVTVLRLGAGGATLEYEPRRLRGVDVARVERRELAAGDRIVFRQPWRAPAIANGAAATVVRTEAGGAVEIRLDSRPRQAVVLDSRAAPLPIDHGYAVTSHAAQGRTVHTVLAAIDTGHAAELVNRQQLNVTVSRATHGLHIFTNDRAALGAAVEREAPKTSALELRRAARRSTDALDPSPTAGRDRRSGLAAERESAGRAGSGDRGDRGDRGDGGDRGGAGRGGTGRGDRAGSARSAGSSRSAGSVRSGGVERPAAAAGGAGAGSGGRREERDGAAGGRGGRAAERGGAGGGQDGRAAAPAGRGGAAGGRWTGAMAGRTGGLAERAGGRDERSGGPGGHGGEGGERDGSGSRAAPRGRGAGERRRTGRAPFARAAGEERGPGGGAEPRRRPLRAGGAARDDRGAGAGGGRGGGRGGGGDAAHAGRADAQDRAARRAPGPVAARLKERLDAAWSRWQAWRDERDALMREAQALRIELARLGGGAVRSPGQGAPRRLGLAAARGLGQGMPGGGGAPVLALAGRLAAVKGHLAALSRARSPEELLLRTVRQIGVARALALLPAGAGPVIFALRLGTRVLTSLARDR